MSAGALLWRCSGCGELFKMDFPNRAEVAALGMRTVPKSGHDWETDSYCEPCWQKRVPA